MNAATPPSPARDARRPSVRRPARSSAVALAVVGVLAASGCTYTNAVTTERPYVPSDGEDVRLSGDISISSLMVITEGEGDPGTLVARVVNSGATDQRVTISSEDADVDEVVDVPANQTVAIGGTAGQEDVTEVLIDAVPVAPGLLVPMSVGIDGGATSSVDVPVLDGTIEPYAEYLPAEPSPTANTTITAPTSTAAPTADAAETTGASSSSSSASSTGGTRTSSSSSSSSSAG